MKFLYALSFLLALTAVNSETYSTENDNLDIDAVVADDATLKGFSGCFLDTVACDPVSADFKKDIPEATETACAKCTDAQKHIYHKFLEGLKTKVPGDYEAFKKKYDPQGKHFAALEAAVAQS
ncbi:ejaculatory bulb-specific protein 3-like [Anticarsia gemmatalis]|uniref:ejaculatory bulb-specific protein 3-like n=1 Tax=Anticarsia gemmatalis TaxID=129554 RepID=UPI003F773BC7